MELRCEISASVVHHDGQKTYAIVRAERAVTHLGHTILLTVKDTPRHTVKIFLPKRYSRVVSDTDILNINMNPEFPCIVYKGFDEFSRYILNIEDL